MDHQALLCAPLLDIGFFTALFVDGCSVRDDVASIGLALLFAAASDETRGDADTNTLEQIASTFIDVCRQGGQSGSGAATTRIASPSDWSLLANASASPESHEEQIEQAQAYHERMLSMSLSGYEHTHTCDLRMVMRIKANRFSCCV